MLVSYLFHSSTLKVGAKYFPEITADFQLLCDVIQYAIGQQNDMFRLHSFLLRTGQDEQLL
jgi:hypothetical protein